MIWEKLKYFKQTENWGEPDKMDEALLLKLDQLRELVKEPININCGTQGEHVTNSLHYQGKAVDICFPESRKPLIDYYFLAERIGFGGIGIYPYWRYDNQIIGGLHLDTRSVSIASRWIGVMINGKTQYLSFNWDNLKNYKIVRG